MVLVKKYGNRRLYDTAASSYITLEELAALIKSGADAQVVDARTGEDLTTPTLAQIIVEGRGVARLLPLPLLVQLIRMGDGALAEFFGMYLTWALDAYLQAKQGAQALNPFGPLFGSSLGSGGLSRLFGLGPAAERHAPPPPPSAAAAGAPAVSSELRALRRELEELKKGLKPKLGPGKRRR